ncbi:MAG: twin-arginine translocase subunit TatC [Nitrospirota bacterium]
MSDERMPLTEHLSELRKRIITSIIAIGVGFLISFNYSEVILGWLKTPLTTKYLISTTYPYIFYTNDPNPVELIFLAPTEAFWMHLKISLIAGLFLALPVVFYQLWKFISPGLLSKEKHYALPFVIIGTTFFVIGALFCFFVVLPFAMKFLLTYKTEHLKPMLSVGKYVDFCLKFILAFGLVFELPLVITFLSKLGLVTPQFLAKHRKYAVLASFIVAALLTPTPDVFNQTLMAVPLIILYEVGIIAARLFGPRHEKD